MPAPQDPQRPFERDAFFDDPGLVGARWWNRAFDAQMEATRRSALKAMTAFGLAVGAVAVLGVGGVAAAVIASPDQKLKKAIDVQRQFGWSVGSFDEPLTWGTILTSAAVDSAAIARLAVTLKPRRYAPFYVGTQLESLGAVPTSKLSGDPYVVKDLRTQLHSIIEPTVTSAFGAGQELGRIFAGRAVQCLVIVDCAGVKSAAFAAGAASVFEPVLVLDNWPHPAGVVPAHQTLSALATFEKQLADGVALRGATPPPLFVLERERGAALVDPEASFDNRYFVSLPSSAVATRWHFKRALLVVDNAAGLPESGDLAVTLAEYAASGMDVRVIGLDLFAWDGTYPGGVAGFFTHHPWAPFPPAPVQPLPAAYATWKPGAASTRVSPKAKPAGFGEVVVYEDSPGVIVGVPAFGGTRARASGGWGG